MEQGPNLQKLHEILWSHPVRHHPFLESFKAGRLTKAQVRYWFEQQFYFSVSLPSAFAALYARIPDASWKEKRKIIDLLNIEAWGATDLECHSHYFTEFAEYLGIDLAKLATTTPKPYVEDYRKLRFTFCLERPLVQGLAAIAFGNELLNMTIYQAYHDGIHKIPGLESCPSGYFDAHMRDETDDCNIFADLLKTLATKEEDWLLAETGLKELLDKRVIFFDRLMEDLKRMV